MKILAIRGKNLASLEGEFEVDFTTEPLQSAGIFAITGSTGAGKSTILDTLCLALFDDAPRLSKAEGLKIEDKGQDNITLKDSRNILRKGAADGYAEVDFIALNGDKYRSRWMVRRARGKADGVLQATTISLDNLSTKVEERGTKRDILIRITEIIGLTFDQFTRAVLLAQGDFSTFLKAKQNEKAELLEKLTGTEIYSKISSLIYQKTGDAKHSLEILRQRMSDIKLLTDEELLALHEAKLNLDNDAKPLKTELLSIEKKLTWIKQEEQLRLEINEADNKLKENQQNIQEAAPRYEYMSLIDTSQQIRDSYIDLANRQKQEAALRADMEAKEQSFKILSEKFDKTDNELKTAKIQLDETEQRYKVLRPDIEKAKELDLKIQAVRQNATELKKEVELNKGQLVTLEQGIASLQAQLESAGNAKKSLSKWFDDNSHYKEIVSRTDLIISLINTAETAGKQRANAANSLVSGISILKTYTDQLILQEQEAERLNNLLPTEVLNLRQKLEEGQPCVVCGSVHHPLKEEANQDANINEKELELAKNKLVDIIAKTKSSIELTQKSITELEVHINSFQSQYDSAINDLKQYLFALSDWESKYVQGVLLKELTAVSSQWNENTGHLNNSTQQIENISVKIEAEQKMLSTVNEDLKKRTESFEALRHLHEEVAQQRKLLLDNRAVDEVENQYTTLKEQYSKQYEQLRSERDKSETEKATIGGIITQLKKDAEICSGQIAGLNKEVQEWVGNNKHQITVDILKDLISRSQEWINQEKNYLNEIKNQNLVLSTTLKERNFRLSKHQESGDRPEMEQTKDVLAERLCEIGEKQEIINKQQTEIEVALTAHRTGKERIAAFENEFKLKDDQYNNWEKLNHLLGSAKGDKFKTIAQGYTLDVLLAYANRHLEDLTRRYKLEKIANSLALQVIDNDMLGEVRTVHSLSGGESFLISLSLALGLSSLSSNRMKIESLFIDEGFGSLDIDTLSIAMDALENLQTQGRKIGVISHVEEMKERISTQIQVIKATNGRSIVKIVG